MYMYMYENQALGESGANIFADNSCSSADCSDMCLPTNGPRHQCACPEDKHLESNNRTCQSQSNS